MNATRSSRIDPVFGIASGSDRCSTMSIAMSALVGHLARRVFGLHEVFAFWFAYIITRPLGASYADWLGVPQSLGGLNFGRGTVAVGLTLAIIVWVGYLWATKVDVEPSDAISCPPPARPHPTGPSSPPIGTELDGPRGVSRYG
jgi:hypothetical protein